MLGTGLDQFKQDVGGHLCIFVDRHAVALGRVPLVHHAQECRVRGAKHVSPPIPASQRVTDRQLIKSAFTLQKAQQQRVTPHDCNA